MKAADEALAVAVAALKKRGINHPYVEELRARAHQPADPGPQDAALVRPDLLEAHGRDQGFDVSAVKYQDIQRAATFAAPAGATD